MKMCRFFMLSFLLAFSGVLVVASENDENLEKHLQHVYAVFGNDNVSGMSQALLTIALHSLKHAGYTIDLLNLYDRSGEIPYFMHGRQNFDAFPFYAENKERFLKADVLLLVFPVYWYSTPAIVKNWIDLLAGWSYTYESGLYGKANHNIKKVIVLFSCFEERVDVNRKFIVENQLSETFKFIGIDDIEFYGVDNVYGLTPEKIEKHFDAVKTIFSSL